MTLDFDHPLVDIECVLAVLSLLLSCWLLWVATRDGHFDADAAPLTTMERGTLQTRVVGDSVRLAENVAFFVVALSLLTTQPPPAWRLLAFMIGHHLLTLHSAWILVQVHRRLPFATGKRPPSLKPPIGPLHLLVLLTLWLAAFAGIGQANGGK